MYYYKVVDLTTKTTLEEHTSFQEAMQCIIDHQDMDEYKDHMFCAQKMDTNDCRTHGIIHKREQDCPECAATAMQDMLSNHMYND